jgi:hypothetical protein
MYTITIYLFASIFMTFFLLESQRLRSTMTGRLPDRGQTGNLLVFGTNGPMDSGLSLNDQLNGSKNLWSAERISKALSDKPSVNDTAIDTKSTWSSKQIAESLIDFSDASLDAVKGAKNNNIPIFRDEQLVDSGFTVDDTMPASAQILYSSMKNDELYQTKFKPGTEGRTVSTIATIGNDGALLDSNIQINDQEGPSNTILWTSARSVKPWVSARIDAIALVQAMRPAPLAVTILDDPTSLWNGLGFFRPRRTGFYHVTFRFFATSINAPAGNFLTVLLTRRPTKVGEGTDTLFQLSYPVAPLFMCNGSEVVQLSRTLPPEELVFTLVATFECAIDGNGSLHIQEL